MIFSRCVRIDPQFYDVLMGCTREGFSETTNAQFSGVLADEAGGSAADIFQETSTSGSHGFDFDFGNDVRRHVTAVHCGVPKYIKLEVCARLHKTSSAKNPPTHILTSPII